MIERYTTLCKAALHGNNMDASRRAKADMPKTEEKRTTAIAVRRGIGDGDAIVYEYKSLVAKRRP